MKKLSIASVKQLSRNEMKKIMAGSGAICTQGCGQICWIKCQTGQVEGECGGTGCVTCSAVC